MGFSSMMDQKVDIGNSANCIFIEIYFPMRLPAVKLMSFSELLADEGNRISVKE